MDAQNARVICGWFYRQALMFMAVVSFAKGDKSLPLKTLRRRYDGL